VRELHQEKPNMGLSSKETRKVDKAIQSKMGRIREAFKEMALWEVAGTPQPPDEVRYGEDKLSAMLKGDPAPWEQPGQAEAVAGMFYGRKYYMLWSEVERCKEQLAILHVERARLHAYLTLEVAACQAACDTHVTKEIGTAATPAQRWAFCDEAGLHAGRLYLVRQRLQWCKSMLQREVELQWQ
jgi:hypothetical protein